MTPAAPEVLFEMAKWSLLAAAAFLALSILEIGGCVAMNRRTVAWGVPVYWRASGDGVNLKAMDWIIALVSSVQSPDDQTWEQDGKVARTTFLFRRRLSWYCPPSILLLKGRLSSGNDGSSVRISLPVSPILFWLFLTVFFANFSKLHVALIGSNGVWKGHLFLCYLLAGLMVLQLTYEVLLLWMCWRE